MAAGMLMVQGTTSDAGKSALVTGLCRWLARQDVRVAPFKPQNMALNAAVTVDGGEIGRAQAVQAYACGIAAHTDMNPVLLKPCSDTGAQVIVQGRALGTMQAREYQAFKPIAHKAVMQSFDRLRRHYDAVVVEGAGSPAEINLRDNDIANMGFAEAVNSPVVMIADIDRGGVFAHIVGTLALLSPSEQARIKGFVINRFRGDLSLLQPGLDWLETKTGKPVIGVLPFLHGLHLQAEDAICMTEPAPASPNALRVIAPVMPRMSNHTDFDPLRFRPDVDFRFVQASEPIPPADLIVLPGSKAVIDDLAFLRARGWDAALRRHLRYGGKVIGLCGGFQMLGEHIHDPLGIEGAPRSAAGFGLFAMSTELMAYKQLRNVSGKLAIGEAKVTGYEIHAGVSTGAALLRPAIHLEDGADGAVSDDGQIIGSYVHGIFDHPDASATLLEWAGLQRAERLDYAALCNAGIDRIADAVQAHLNTELILQILALPGEAR